ncbi:MAG: hypothetical protein HYV59_12290 [Planctomycetes bacterium]|nr:hypothetical protein [Planctomycetota bacterium]
MHNCGRKQIAIVFGVVSVVLMMSGCAIKHSDVMLFGTNTKYGLSIAMDQPESTPHINVGYKRQEFVWMPLVANGADSVIQTKVGTASAQDLKYLGKEPTGKEDTYSVLASFGANFKASGAAGGGGIAQYFATGMAARKLAEVGGASLVQASNVNLTPSPETVAAANKQEVIVRTPIYVEKTRLDRVRIIQGKIKGLDADRLKELAKNPPVQEKAGMDFVNEKIDPNKTRESDPEMAKKVLLILVSEGEPSDANLEAWENALGIKTTE